MDMSHFEAASTSETGQRVLSVGQCGPDHQSISRFLARYFGVEVESADSCDEAQSVLRAGKFSLVLVNRLLDIDGSPGLNVVCALKNDPDHRLASVPVMLVSNDPDAQQAAIAQGAVSGFGKADLASPATLALLKAHLIPPK
jgi:two-component system chemotaxis response regulator CheY